MSIQLFKQYTQAMVDSDWNTIASMYAEDCVSVDPDGAVFEGREANLENDQKWASMMSDFRFNYARFEIRVKQAAGEAKTNIKGMQITKKNEQISTYTKIEFNGPNGFLDQINKSLADDKSHAIFEGSIIVPQIAQRTNASQLSRNLLLSKFAQIDTKPQLEIIADDVKCKHGATISQLNDEELFYMRTRGITLTEASKLQLSSYFQEIISFLPISKDRWDLLYQLLNEN